MRVTEIAVEILILSLSKDEGRGLHDVRHAEEPASGGRLEARTPFRLWPPFR